MLKGIDKMDKEIKDFIFKTLIVVALICLLAVYISVWAKLGYKAGYVDACKDFYKGKLKYDLVENPDGTKEWKKIEKSLDK